MFQPLFLQARRRGEIVLAAAAGVILAVAVYGVLIYGSLPDSIPTRIREENGSLSWSTNNPVIWVDKSAAVFRPLLLGLFLLALFWVVTRFFVFSFLYLKMTRFLIGRLKEQWEAQAGLFLNDLGAFLAAGCTVAMVIDSGQLWKAALDHVQPPGPLLGDVIAILMLMGLAISTWVSCRRVASMAVPNSEERTPDG